LLLILIVVTVTLAGSAYAWHVWRKHEDKQVPYTVERVQRGTLEEIVSAAGKVLPRELYIVGSEVPGKVTAVLADYNQTVSEGDVLLRLDDRLAKARLEEAKVDVNLARAALKQAEIQRDPTIDRWGPRMITVRDGYISGDSPGKAA
jgi:multidrug efflux pump subunit AcrA (membrane-fusion protein)